MISKKRIFLLAYLITICYLMIEIILSEKSIFNYISNSELIKQQSDKLNMKLAEQNEINIFLKKFKNDEEVRKLIIKEKLFYKEKGEKIIQYKIIDQ